MVYFLLSIIREGTEILLWQKKYWYGSPKYWILTSSVNWKKYSCDRPGHWRWWHPLACTGNHKQACSSMLKVLPWTAGISQVGPGCGGSPQWRNAPKWWHKPSHEDGCPRGRVCAINLEYSDMKGARHIGPGYVASQPLGKWFGLVYLVQRVLLADGTF